MAGGRGRVDLAVEVDGREQMFVIIEIKGTDWDTIPAARFCGTFAVIFARYRPTLTPPSRRCKQASGLAASWTLLYPARPASAATQQAIEDAADERAITVRGTRKLTGGK